MDWIGLKNMDRKYVFIIGIGLVVLMQALVLALIPPPPVNQNMGMYDTLFLNVNESGCRNCHASGVVDNFDDGHYIPSYPPSSMTPDTKFKVINQTSGRKWGGCESCHEQDLTANPFIAYNNKTHHNLGNLSGFKNNDNTRCEMCHDMHNATFGSDSIRYCERCHSYNSLHNIQWDIANTATQTGYG